MKLLRLLHRRWQKNGHLSCSKTWHSTRIFRLCSPSAGRILVAGWCRRDRLCSQRKLRVDLSHSSARFRYKGWFWLGDWGSYQEEKDRLFKSRISDLWWGLVRSVHAHWFLWRWACHCHTYAWIHGAAGLCSGYYRATFASWNISEWCQKGCAGEVKNGDQTSYKESVTRMNVILEKWTHEFKPELIKICNGVDRFYLLNRLPYPYTEELADWWLGMVSEARWKGRYFSSNCSWW